jgi:hypothetical protein
MVAVLAAQAIVATGAATLTGPKLVGRCLATGEGLIGHCRAGERRHGDGGEKHVAKNGSHLSSPWLGLRLSVAGPNGLVHGEIEKNRRAILAAIS